MPSPSRPALPALVLACLLVAPAWAADPATAPAPAEPPSAETPAPPADPAAELQAYKAALDNARRRIEALEAELNASRERLALMEDSLTAAGIDPETGDAPAAASEPPESDRAAQLRREREEAKARVAAIRQRRAAQREAERRAADEKQALAPRWAHTWEIGFLDTGRRSVTYVKQSPAGTVVFTGERSSIDRHNIILRGTFENRSSHPYRYTFDAGVLEENTGGDFFAVRDGLTARTRYQTPVLAPGELHRWEVRLSVNNAFDIRSGGIGNVRADAATPIDAPGTDPAAMEAAPAEGAN